MTMKKGRDIKPLGEELTLVQLRKKEKEFKSKINIKGKLRHLMITTIVVSGAAIALRISSTPETLNIVLITVLSVGATMAGVDIIKTGLDFRKRVKKINSVFEESKEKEDLSKAIVKVLSTTPELQILQEKEFYSTKMNDYITYEENKDENGYNEALNIQRNRASIRLCNPNENCILSKEEAVAKVMHELDAYLVGLELPPIQITDNEWDIFFNALYDLLCKKNATEEFYDIAAMLCRITLSNSLVYNFEYICIKDFIESFEYLGSEFGFFSVSLSKGEISKFKKGLIEKTNSEKVISLKINRKKSQDLSN